jgi:hypothetical protein
MADENIKSVSCSFLDGVGSSQAIDTAGEIVDLAGIDASSLVGGALNWEHKSDVPAQLVGKVLEYKKIFSEKDIENDRHQYYWDKTKTPFLYVMGRLFDDKKESSKECAAVFMDDREHPEERPMLGFSIEGSKVDKKGIIVTKSIARKITITNTNANKQCVAELVPGPEAKPSSDTNSIFKSEPSHTIELLEKAETKHERGVHQPLASMSARGSKNSEDKTLQGMSSMGYNVRNPRPTMVDPKVKASQKLEEQRKMPKPDLGKKEVPGSKIPAAQAAPGPSKAVKGAPGWKHTGGGNFHHPEHGIVSVIKQGNEFHVKHKGSLAGVGGKKGTFGSSKEAGGHAGDYMRSLGQGKTMGAEMHSRPSPSMDKSLTGRTGGMGGRMGGMIGGGLPQESTDKKNKRGLFNPDVDKIQGRGMMGGGMMRSEKKGNLKKAMTAGSGMCGPGNLTQGAALAPESVDKKMKKSQWLARAEEAYQSWEKREQFENFMAKHLPNLTKSEIHAIGATLALRKSLRAEKRLASMVIDEGQDSWVKKKEK